MKLLIALLALSLIGCGKEQNSNEILIQEGVIFTHSNLCTATGESKSLGSIWNNEGSTSTHCQGHINDGITVCISKNNKGEITLISTIRKVETE